MGRPRIIPYGLIDLVIEKFVEENPDFMFLGRT